MSDTNFIPAPILRQRRRRRRAVVCGAACSLYTLGVLIVIAALNQAADSNHQSAFELQDANALIEESRASIERMKKELARTRAVLTSQEHLSARPNWGELLGVLAQAPPDDVFLTRCDVRSSAGRLPITVTLGGFAPSQAQLSPLLVGLQETRLFDEVSLRHAKRGKFGAAEGLSFEIVCIASGASHE